MKILSPDIDIIQKPSKLFKLNSDLQLSFSSEVVPLSRWPFKIRHDYPMRWDVVTWSAIGHQSLPTTASAAHVLSWLQKATCSASAKCWILHRGFPDEVNKLFPPICKAEGVIVCWLFVLSKEAYLGSDRSRLNLIGSLRFTRLPKLVRFLLELC